MLKKLLFVEKFLICLAAICLIWRLVEGRAFMPFLLLACVLLGFFYVLFIPFLIGVVRYATPYSLHSLAGLLFAGGPFIIGMTADNFEVTPAASLGYLAIVSLVYLVAVKGGVYPLLGKPPLRQRLLTMLVVLSAEIGYAIIRGLIDANRGA